jgi:hypothetical protein
MEETAIEVLRSSGFHVPAPEYQTAVHATGATSLPENHPRAFGAPGESGEKS